jgi:hypothetical protein
VAGSTTGSFNIIAPAASKALVEATIANLDPTGTATLGVPLRAAGDATNTTVAWACGWAMDDATTQNMKAAFRNAGWSPRQSNAETTIWSPTGAPTADGTATSAWTNIAQFGSGQRMWVFDAVQATFDECLASIGLARPLPQVLPVSTG